MTLTFILDLEVVYQKWSLYAFKS